MQFQRIFVLTDKGTVIRRNRKHLLLSKKEENVEYDDNDNNEDNYSLDFSDPGTTHDSIWMNQSKMSYQ